MWSTASLFLGLHAAVPFSSSRLAFLELWRREATKQRCVLCGLCVAPLFFVLWTTFSLLLVCL